jgi:hypothetical protein
MKAPAVVAVLAALALLAMVVVVPRQAARIDLTTTKLDGADSLSLEAKGELPLLARERGVARRTRPRRAAAIFAGLLARAFPPSSH